MIIVKKQTQDSSTLVSLLQAARDGLLTDCLWCLSWANTVDPILWRLDTQSIVGMNPMCMDAIHTSGGAQVVSTAIEGLGGEVKVGTVVEGGVGWRDSVRGEG